MKKNILWIVLMILGLWTLRAEAGDDLCLEGFKGCVMGAAAMYDLCQVEENCTKTLEEVKNDCMAKFPDCADRAWLETEFNRQLANGLSSS